MKKILTVIYSLTCVIGLSQTLDFLKPKNLVSDYMDELRLRSDNSSYFTLANGAISQWTDTSKKLRHATQSTTSSKPLYNSGSPTFDGSNDFLTTASEIDLLQLTIVVVYKPSALDKVIFGGSSRNDYCWSLSSGYTTQFNISGGGQGQGDLGVKNRLNVVILRRNGSTFMSRINGVNSPHVTSSLSSSLGFRLGLIGKGTGGFNFNGVIKEISVSSGYLTDAECVKIENQLNSLYSAPENITERVIGFGDSNTENSNSYLSTLASYLNLSFINQGKSGSKLTSGTNNGNDRFAGVISRPYKDKLVIMYGTNDASNGVSSSAISSSMDYILSTAINSGYSPSDILVCSAPYQKFNANASVLDSYESVIHSKATFYGTKYCDVLNWCRNNGGDDLMVDALHFTTAGYSALAAKMYSDSGW